MSGFFIAGTDTGVGKTTIACGLLQAWAQAGFRTQAIKPVAAGCEATAQGLRNDDALALMAAMSASLEYAQVNPVALLPAIAPHIAARQAGLRPQVRALAAHGTGLLNRADITLVEGAGGWRVPLNDEETLADLARALNLPVILVVGVRLGCINHALLTAEAIAADGLPLAGWVANVLDAAMPEQAATIEAVQQRLAAPLLGVVPWHPDPQPDRIASHMDITKLAGFGRRTI
ncbi:MAG TPA: dethiobiotin synthase [Pseudomonadales bacterium]|jgi:dethiobiotin synthetase